MQMRHRTTMAALALTCWLAALSPAAPAQEQLAQALARLAPVFGRPENHQRKGKEDLYAIARQYGVSASSVHNANPGDLLAGDELLLIPKEHIAPARSADGVVVNLTERALYLYQDGAPVRRFPVAIGMRGWETPTGEFTIVNRAKNPTWFPPSWALEEKPVPPGPDNPLGDRWMGLSLRGYGIHATNAPWTVGRYVSHGCLRMYPEHAHELYDLVKVGTPVQIVYRRIVFGYRPEAATVFMAYHPDPYQTGEMGAESVREALREYGLDQTVDMAAVARALQRPTGLPVPIAGSPTRLVVNGRPVKLALGPTRVGSDWLVPAGPLASALGATIELGFQGSYVVVGRGGVEIFYAPGRPEALVNGQLVSLESPSALAAGYPLIPLRATAVALGGSVGWDQQRQTILVWDAWSRLGHTSAEGGSPRMELPLAGW